MGTGKESHPSSSRKGEPLLTPLSAETILHSDEDIGKTSAPHYRDVTQPSSSSAAPMSDTVEEAAGVAAAASTAAASAEAAAEAAAKANAVAAATVCSNEDSDSSCSTKSSTDTDEDLLDGLRASRAFKVVPSQIKDLLDDNTHALRVTPRKGIESKLRRQSKRLLHRLETACISVEAREVSNWISWAVLLDTSSVKQ